MTERASPDRPDWAPTAAGRLRSFMADGAWHGCGELEYQGGRRFPARLHEIARGADGLPALAYDVRAVDGREGVFEYRLRPYRDDEERPQPRRLRAKARIEELYAEVQRLRARVAELEGGAHA